MRIAQDEQFRRERGRYRLKFTCEDCSHFAAPTETCTHGYPTPAHRAARYEAPEPDLLFCKDFDLI